ncbi:MAG: hypothetical protein HC899_30215 [Leptolyngbyaceae cyanobacterium SM1_4_3]|nr:hypothetical protein [Leptolyngbyaceae cyanobacterium SM1_4_3]
MKENGATKSQKSLEGKNIIFDGGGSIIDLYKRDANYLEKYHREAKKVVILPQTINGNEQLLASLDSNVDILCRELTSFEYVKSVVTKANVFLMDDMAFSIDVDKTLAAKSLYSKRMFEKL